MTYGSKSIHAGRQPVRDCDRENIIHSLCVHCFEERKGSGIQRFIRGVGRNLFDDDMTMASQESISVDRLRRRVKVGFCVGIQSSLLE